MRRREEISLLESVICRNFTIAKGDHLQFMMNNEILATNVVDVTIVLPFINNSAARLSKISRMLC